MTTFLALLGLIFFMALLGLLLGYFAQRFHNESDPIVEKIEAVLPQTQCGQCGFAGCKPYAQAIAAGKADINRCPPGGEEGVAKLAELLGVTAKPLDTEVGAPKPPQVAWIVEDWCIGCTRCIQACPVDAIVGSTQRMHTVLSAECTGCELCIAPCPVDCIVMKPRDAAFWQWQPPQTPLESTQEHHETL